MREYLEQILHQSIQEHPYESLEKLPLGCRNAFALSIVEIQKQEILIDGISMCFLFKKNKLVFSS